MEEHEYTVKEEVIDGQVVQVKVYPLHGTYPKQITKPCDKIVALDEYEIEAGLVEGW